MRKWRDRERERGRERESGREKAREDWFRLQRLTQQQFRFSILFRSLETSSSFFLSTTSTPPTGIPTVAVFSDADARAPHVSLADEAVRLGPPPPSSSYLDVERILEAARETGATAVHPGYGFLSESSTFAERVVARKLTWVGPPPGAMRSMGDKARAKQLMSEAGVPVVPGYHGDDQSDER